MGEASTATTNVVAGMHTLKKDGRFSNFAIPRFPKTPENHSRFLVRVLCDYKCGGQSAHGAP